MTLTLANVSDLAGLSGLRVLGVTPLTPMSEESARIRQWQELGYGGEMTYLLRDPDELVSPQRLLPEGLSVIVVAVAYDRRGDGGPRPAGHGRVARYAWGRDYHKVIPRRLKGLVTLLEEHCGRSIRSRIFTDAVPLLERPLAKRAGLGFIGKNTLLIRPGDGSFLLLGGVIIDQPIVLPEVEGRIKQEMVPAGSDVIGGITSGAVTRPALGCGPCTRCLTHCPTGALVAEFMVDARLCISYLTIEKRGWLCWEDRTRLGEWIFGCDICQEVCPFNHRALRRRDGPEFPELGAAHGAGPYLSLAEILKIRTGAEYLKRFAGTPLMRPKREGLLRNACCVSANTGDAEVIPLLLSAASDDASAVVRGHALWALATHCVRWGNIKSSQVAAALDRGAVDEDPAVIAEVKKIREEIFS